MDRKTFEAVDVALDGLAGRFWPILQYKNQDEIKNLIEESQTNRDHLVAALSTEVDRIRAGVVLRERFEVEVPLPNGASYIYTYNPGVILYGEQAERAIMSGLA